MAYTTDATQTTHIARATCETRTRARNAPNAHKRHGIRNAPNACYTQNALSLIHISEPTRR
eukprot:61705-Lingulodinium_polyedra.AAC.1